MLRCLPSLLQDLAGTDGMLLQAQLAELTVQYCVPRTVVIEHIYAFVPIGGIERGADIVLVVCPMCIDLPAQVIIGGLPVGMGQQERPVVLLQLGHGGFSIEAALLHFSGVQRPGEAVEGEQPQQQGQQQNQGKRHDQLPDHITAGRHFIVSKDVHWFTIAA